MTDHTRTEIAEARRVVVKVGTRVVCDPQGLLDVGRLGHLVEQMKWLLERDRQIVLVSSGAVGAGMSQLGWTERPADLAQLQAVAAVGQTKLVEHYDRLFRRHGLHAAQVLLTSADLEDRARYLNVRNTVLTLLELGTVPIINENDTVAVEELELTFGDNDRLASLVTNLLQAPLLIFLSDVEGLYDGLPAAPDSHLISTVDRIDDGILSLARDSTTGLSRGGMASKLTAARMLTTAGEHVILANGHRPDVLVEILTGENVGTLFRADGKTPSPWKRWIGFSARPSGQLWLDAGACQAILTEGRSLLPIGIVKVEGNFQKGDVVSLLNPAGREIARGLTNYAAHEITLIKGQRSDCIGELLGHSPYEEVIHRDNFMPTA